MSTLSEIRKTERSEVLQLPNSRNNLGELIDNRIKRKMAERRATINAGKASVRKILQENAEIAMGGEGRTGGLCLGVHAPWSKGKTLALVFFAKRRNEDEGLPIVSNFRITSLSDFTFLDDIEILKDIQGAGVMIDEIRRYMDSYMSRGAKARFTSNLTADLGKQSCDLYYSDQHYNAAPPRLKTNLSIIAEPDFDDESQWVTLYLYQSIEDYIYKNQFFYFGFYGPDYWKYYDTRTKIEDYRIKFKVDRYAGEFLEWYRTEDYTAGMKLTKDVLNLWNQSQGREFTAQELSAIFTYLKITGVITSGKKVE